MKLSLTENKIKQPMKTLFFVLFNVFLCMFAHVSINHCLYFQFSWRNTKNGACLNVFAQQCKWVIVKKQNKKTNKHQKQKNPNKPDDSGNIQLANFAGSIRLSFMLVVQFVSEMEACNTPMKSATSIYTNELSLFQQVIRPKLWQFPAVVH